MDKIMNRSMQLELRMDYSVTREMACVMCHLSSECLGCSEKCRTEGRNGTCHGQACSQPTRDTEGKRWEAWMHFVRVHRPDLRRFVPEKYLKGIGTKGRH